MDLPGIPGSRQVLPDAGPCNNEIFIDLAFEGTLRAFGEAADVVLDVKRLGGRVMLIYLYLYMLILYFFCFFGWFPSILGSWCVL